MKKNDCKPTKKDILDNVDTRAIVKYNLGKIDSIAFVFACPGQEELKNNKVVFGATGTNLDELLKKLKHFCLNKFPSTNRYDYLITNSSERVYYKGYKDKQRTTPYACDISKDDNIDRLYKELKNSSTIIIFGNDARKAIGLVKKKYDDFQTKKIIDAQYHLGQLGLMVIHKDINGNQINKKQNNSTDLRLEVIAYDIWKQLNGK